LSELEQLREDLKPYVVRGELAYAGSYIDENLGHPEEIASLLNIRGMAALQSGDVALARKAFEAALALVPEEDAFRSNLGLACAQGKDFDAAARAFREVLSRNPAAEPARGTLVSIQDRLGPSPRVLQAFYDLDKSPPTFDFLVFLALAELARRRRGLEALRVIFVPGQADGFRAFTPRDRMFERGRKEWRLHNVLAPACRLVSASLEPVLCTNREEALRFEGLAAGAVFPEGYRVDRPLVDYHLGGLLHIGSKGVEVRVLEAPAQALVLIRRWLTRHAPGRPVVTISLRESDFEPERNSDAASWVRVAQWLEDKGFMPVIVPDTEALLNGAGEWRGTGAVCHPAALNLELRAALYAESHLNLMLSGGNAFLCVLSARARYVMFLRVIESLYIWSDAGHRRHGMVPGEQLAFAGEFQRAAWAGDGYEQVVAEAQAMLERIQ
jgi:hypothetical protein